MFGLLYNQPKKFNTLIQYFITTLPACARPPVGRRDPSSYEEGNFNTSVKLLMFVGAVEEIENTNN